MEEDSFYGVRKFRLPTLIPYFRNVALSRLSNVYFHGKESFRIYRNSSGEMFNTAVRGFSFGIHCQVINILGLLPKDWCPVDTILSRKSIKERVFNSVDVTVNTENEH